MDTMERGAAAAEQSDSVVLMYPGNQLRDQYRDYEDTQSPFKVLDEAFFRKD